MRIAMPIRILNYYSISMRLLLNGTRYAEQGVVFHLTSYFQLYVSGAGQ